MKNTRYPPGVAKTYVRIDESRAWAGGKFVAKNVQALVLVF